MEIEAMPRQRPSRRCKAERDRGNAKAEAVTPRPRKGTQRLRPENRNTSKTSSSHVRIINEDYNHRILTPVKTSDCISFRTVSYRTLWAQADTADPSHDD